MKALLKIAKIVCYVCSFPLFMVFAILASMHNVEKGGSYGLLTYFHNKEKLYAYEIALNGGEY